MHEGEHEMTSAVTSTTILISPSATPGSNAFSLPLPALASRTPYFDESTLLKMATMPNLPFYDSVTVH
jgi:hypothetical protein